MERHGRRVTERTQPTSTRSERGGHCEQAEGKEEGEDSERGMGRLPDEGDRSVTTELLLLLLEDVLGVEDNAPSLSVQQHAGHLVISCGGGGCEKGGGTSLLQQ